MKRSDKILFVIMVLSILASVFLIVMPKAHSAPWNNCEPQGGYTPPYYSTCNGYNQSCYLAFKNCTTVPDVPGTWGPTGYTPCQVRTGCN